MKKYLPQERDVELVFQIYLHRYLSSSLIYKLPLEHGGKPNAKYGDFPSLQVARRRLRVLKGLKFIEEFYVTGYPEKLYKVNKKGVELVAIPYGIDVDDLPWTLRAKPTDYLFTRHFLLTNAFRIALARACRGEQIKLEGFIPEYYGTHHESGRTTKYVRDTVKDIVFSTKSTEEKLSHAPGGVFVLSRANKAVLHFLEIDRGSESLSNPEKGVLKMIRWYLSFLESEQFKSYEADFNMSFDATRVLIVTKSGKRLMNIREKMQEHIPEKFEWLKKFFWLTIADEENPVDSLEGVINNPSWLSLEATDTNFNELFKRSVPSMPKNGASRPKRGNWFAPS